MIQFPAHIKILQIHSRGRFWDFFFSEKNFSGKFSKGKGKGNFIVST
jgi:hypothetical protein